jgi:hypothetical protein
MSGIKKTHCLRGHERTPDNVTERGMCKICAKLSQPERDRRYNKKHPERKKEKDKRSRIKNRIKRNAAIIAWQKRNPEKAKAIVNRSRLVQRANLNDSYIANVLGSTVKNTPPEIIKLKRAILLYKREIKNVINQ